MGALEALGVHVEISKAPGNKCNRCYKVKEDGERWGANEWVCEFCAEVVKKYYPDVWEYGMVELQKELVKFDSACAERRIANANIILK